MCHHQHLAPVLFQIYISPKFKAFNYKIRCRDHFPGTTTQHTNGQDTTTHTHKNSVGTSPFLTVWAAASFRYKQRDKQAAKEWEFPNTHTATPTQVLLEQGEILFILRIRLTFVTWFRPYQCNAFCCLRFSVAAVVAATWQYGFFCTGKKHFCPFFRWI